MAVHLKNHGARLCVRTFGKLFEVTHIARTVDDANRYMEAHPGEALIDTALSGDDVLYLIASNEPMQDSPSKAPSKPASALKTWALRWGPTGQDIGTVQAKSASAAKRKAPMPYRKFLGEIGATEQGEA